MYIPSSLTDVFLTDIVSGRLWSTLYLVLFWITPCSEDQKILFGVVGTFTVQVKFAISPAMDVIWFGVPRKFTLGMMFILRVLFADAAVHV